MSKQATLAFEVPPANRVALTEELITIFKHASNLSPHFFHAPGNIVAVKNDGRSPTVGMISKIGIELPEIAIANFPQFVSILASMKATHLEFEADYVNIIAGNSKARWIYAEKAAIQSWVMRTSGLPITTDPSVVFKLTSAALLGFQKIAKPMDLAGLYFEATSEGFNLVGRRDVIKDTLTAETEIDGNTYEVKVENANVIKPCRNVINLADTILMPDDYEVSVYNEQGFATFKATRFDITYFVKFQNRS